MRQTILLLAALLLVLCSACKPKTPPAKPPAGPTKNGKQGKNPGKNPEDPGAGQAGSLQAFRQEVVADQFNDTLRDAERKIPAAERGGGLVIRVPTMPQGLNRYHIDQNTADASEVCQQINSYLVEQDPETLEWLPMGAQYWTVQDVVDLLPDGQPEKPETKYVHRYGLVEGQVTPGKPVVLWEGARRVVVGVFDVATDPLKLAPGKQGQGKLVLKSGEVFEGLVSRPMRHTYQIVDRSQAKRVEIAWDQLGKRTWRLGDKGPMDRTGVRPSCRYVYHLRKELRWHDGRPLTADDVLFTIETVARNPSIPCQNIRSTLVDLLPLTRLDRHAIQFDWKRPFFQSLETGGGLFLLPKHVFWKDIFQGDPKSFADAFNKHPAHDKPIGFGPFRFEKWDRNQGRLSLVRNAEWFAARMGCPWITRDQPYLDRISWFQLDKPAASMKGMLAGDVDLDKEVEPQTWIGDDTNAPAFTGRFARAEWLGPSYTYIGWNLKRDKFKDARVRRALTMLIDREQMAKVEHKGLPIIISGPFFPLSPACDRSIKPWPFDKQRALALLAEAGVADVDGDRWLDYRDSDGTIKRFTVKYAHHTAREYHTQIAIRVKGQFEAAGIQTTLESMDFKVFSQYAKRREFESIRYAWTAEIDPDPYPIWHSSQIKDGNNYVGYSNPEVDRICEEVRITFDPFRRWSLLRKMHRILHQDQPNTFMFLFKNLAFYNKQFRGVKFYTSNWLGVDYTQWWLPRRFQEERKARGAGK